MSGSTDTFFTVVGCMDGRVQEGVAEYGSKKYEAKYPDTITDAGIVKRISQNPDPKYFGDLQKKLLVSVDKHHSKGIIVDGHQECAGNPVDDVTHKKDILNAVEFVKILVAEKVPVAGVFVTHEKNGWTVNALEA